MAELKLKYNPAMDKPTAIQSIMYSVQSLIDQGFIDGRLEDAVLDVVFDDEANSVAIVIDDSKMIDALRSQDYMDTVDFDELAKDTVKSYSVRTIKERLKIQDLPLKKQLRFLILDHRRYYKMNLKKFIEDPTQFYRLKELFITDLMGYFSVILPECADGQNLAKLLGLQALAPKTMAAGRKLSLDYKMMTKVGGAPKALMNRAQEHYKEFIDALTDAVYRGWRSKIAGEEVTEEELGEDPIDETALENELGDTREESTRTEGNKEFANTMQGEEAEGETIELTPAEEELLKRESELNGDGATTYSEDKLEWADTKEFQHYTNGTFGLIDSEMEESLGYDKFAVIVTGKLPQDMMEALRRSGAHFYQITSGEGDAQCRTTIIFATEEMTKSVLPKTFSEPKEAELPKIDWRYTLDLIKSGYKGIGLANEQIKKIHEDGLKRYHRFDDRTAAYNYFNRMHKLDEPNCKIYEVRELGENPGQVWIIFANTECTRSFSKSSISKFGK